MIASLPFGEQLYKYQNVYLGKHTLALLNLMGIFRSDSVSIHFCAELQGIT
jgi:hypothetical protein